MTTPGGTWRTQWARVQEQLTIFRQVHTGRPGDYNTSLAACETFFVALDDLKNSLIEDDESGVSKGDVEGFVGLSIYLPILQRLAAASRDGQLRWFNRNDATIMLGVGVAYRYYVGYDDVEFDSLNIGEGAVKEWSDFLRVHDLN